MSIKNKLIIQLLEELDLMVKTQDKEWVDFVHATISEQEEQIKLLRAENEELRRKQDHSEVDKLRRELKRMEESTKPRNMKKVSEYTLEMFKDIKDGNGCIQQIVPTIGNWKSLKNYPFTFEMGNMGCVFEKVQLVGCFEREGLQRKYYSHSEGSSVLNREILKQIVGATSGESLDCRVITEKSRKNGKKLRGYSNIHSILELNPRFDVLQQRFISEGYTKFVYTENNGTNYILNSEGEVEYI